ncbi:hypothetical protein N0V88_006871 [Collariella sp. IMI 366227]|nr:hypothetical protein N0V88_006871 [Collariella sp. IMI 366227]
MEPNAATVRLDGLDGDLSKNVLSPGYDTLDQRGLGFDVLPWCSPDSVYPVSTYLDSPACDYFPLRRGSATVFPNPGTNILQWATPGAPIPGMGCGLEAPMLPSDPWAGETDSDGCDLFSEPPSSRTSQQFLAGVDLASLADPTGVHHHRKRSCNEDPTGDKSKRNKPTKPPAPGAVPTSAIHSRKHSIQLRTAARKPRKSSRPSPPPHPPPPRLTLRHQQTLPLSTEDDDLTPRSAAPAAITTWSKSSTATGSTRSLSGSWPCCPWISAVRAPGLRAGDALYMGGGGGGSGGDEKRMSKAEVLDLATRRIRTLEVERIGW